MADAAASPARSPQWISPREHYGDPLGPHVRWLLDTMPWYWNWNRYVVSCPFSTRPAGRRRAPGCPEEPHPRPGRFTTTRRCADYVLRRLAIDKATVAAVARELGRSWDTVNRVPVAATEALLLTAGPARLDGSG